MNRRDVLGGAGAIGAALSAAGGVVAIAAQAAPASPDAELIAACRTYPAAAEVPGACELDDSPASLAHTAIINAIDAHPPRSLAGLIAKARAATCNKATAIELQKWGGYEAGWGCEIVHDFLRLVDAGVITDAGRRA